MLDGLPAIQTDGVDRQCKLWIFRWSSIQAGEARTQRAVEHAQTLSRRKILPKCSANWPAPLASRVRKQPTNNGIAIAPAARARETSNAQLPTPNVQQSELSVGC